MLNAGPRARWSQVGDGIFQLQHQGHTATVTVHNGGRASLSVSPNGPVSVVDNVSEAQVQCEDYLACVPEAHVRVDIPACLLPEHLREGNAPNINAIRDALLRGYPWPGCELVPIAIP